MSDAHSTDEGADRVRVEDVADHTVRLALVEAALLPARHDPARILPAMLEEREPLADLRGDVDAGVGEDEAKNSAHWEMNEHMVARATKRRMLNHALFARLGESARARACVVRARGSTEKNVRPHIVRSIGGTSKDFGRLKDEAGAGDVTGPTLQFARLNALRFLLYTKSPGEKDNIRYEKRGERDVVVVRCKRSMSNNLWKDELPMQGEATTRARSELELLGLLPRVVGVAYHT
jgi:hypothetical protein